MAKKKKEYLSIVKKSWCSEPEIKIFDRMYKATAATAAAVYLIANTLKEEGYNTSVKILEDGSIQCKAHPHYVTGNVESRYIGE